MLRIAIPTQNDRLYPHFGRAPQFTIFEVDDDSRRILDTRRLEPDPQEPCHNAIETLHRCGVGVVITGGIGHGAHRRLTAAGIDVFAGAEVEAADSLVHRFLAGELDRGAPSCHGHEGGHPRGRHHGHGHGPGGGGGRRRGHDRGTLDN
ncbi:MAG: NifB/NifX family molybdenum-iron cluster-binding protein [Planctomycetota bacterium]|nr:NifB/NifX family molybdenum-iron cluster-binding protein [Planctomycetota bacterium]